MASPTNPSLDRKVVVITIVCTLLIITDFYFRLIPGWKAFDRLALFFFVPLAFILLVFRDHPRAYGFQIGDWKAGLSLTAISLALVLPVVWFLVRGDQSLTTYYQRLSGPAIPVYVFLEILGWEFMFRGWMLFGYTRQFGPQGIWLHCGLFALAHLGKPALETFTTLAGGYAFGWLAYRTRSFLYPFLIHWALMTFVVLAARAGPA